VALALASARRQAVQVVEGALQMLLVVGGLLPVAAMLAALFAAVWIREGWESS
jgi:hypothetical protein